MGASSSSSPPTLTPANEYETKIFSHSENCPTNDERQRTYSYKKENQPQLRNTCSHVTLKTGGLWDQKSMTSSISNILSPKHETLCTTQMTGWQSASNHDSLMCQQNNEIDLSRIISQLAMANHQLAKAYNATLTHMEMLCLELSKNGENQKQISEVSKNKLQDKATDNEEMRKLEQRIVRLEKLLASCFFKQSKQECSEEDSKLYSKIETTENSLKTRDSGNENFCLKSAESCCESMKQQTNRVLIDASKVPDDYDETKKKTDIQCCGNYFDDSEMNILKLGENLCSMNVELDKMRIKRTRLRDDIEDSTKIPMNEEVFKLSEEVERLKADRLEFQNANEKLLRTLTDQKKLVEKLGLYYEELRTQYIAVEANLHEHRQQCDELTEYLDCAKKEVKRLLKKIDSFQLEKDTADARVLILEQKLQKSLLEIEQIKNSEKEEILELQTQLSEEKSDKMKQIKALEDALQEIKRLKEIIKTEQKDEDNVLSEDIESTDDASRNTSNPNSATSSMDEFRKELTLKREVRHRAMAAVSSEMERLRKELNAEKEAHSVTSNILAQLRSQNNTQDFHITRDDFIKATVKKQEERKLMDENEKALKQAEAQRLTYILKVSDELRNNVRYQIEKVDDLRYQLETDSDRHRQRIHCLAEVANKARISLVARERQTNELKDYLAQLLVRLGDKSFLEIQGNIGIECNRQLENINALKSLYNERLKILAELKDSTTRELTDVKQKLEYTLKKSENLEEELKKAEDKVYTQDTEITNLESQLGLTKADCRDLQNQMSLINGLFTQMLLGASSADMDLDRLTQLLQENHDLISDIAKEESTEAAALPKLLLDLIKQVEGKTSQKHTSEENGAENEIDKKEDDLQEENIAHNLPKVWRVLFELLSCHAVTSPTVSVASCSDPNSCYKSVDTPAGPRLVISVSKTYIRLKELILEKKHLEKEMNRMKQLNAHLESKLGEQEKRLSMVSDELAKTWNIVDRMQVQHQQLHTHEEILRYELQEKRKMLQELKQELEYCREKWESARQKNTNTEREWRNLRREFAARKALAIHDSFNSAESGFSDERGDDTDEEEAIEGRIRHGPRRRTRKENTRALTPDTESEQPTDTELSESKTGSSATLEQRTPTPETELDEAEIAHIDSKLNITKIDSTMEDSHEILDPLDQALTNVIQNLIKINNEESDENVLQKDMAISFKDSYINQITEISNNLETDQATTSKTDFCENQLSLMLPTESQCSLFTEQTLKRASTNIDLSLTSNTLLSTKNLSKQYDENNIDEKIKSESTATFVSHKPITNTNNTVSIFSIGPIPTSATSSSKSVQFSNPLIVGPSNRLLASMFGTVSTELEQFMDSTCSSNQKEESEDQSFKPIDNIIDSDNISVDSSSSLDTVKEFPTIDVNLISSSIPKDEQQGSTMTTQREITSTKSPEEVLATRADRLKRLEEQADWLMKKMNATNKRGTALCTKLEELHEAYSEPPVPPPMPDVLPNCRLPSALSNLPQISESTPENITNVEGENLDATKSNTSNVNTP